jgi:hypothetical protein
MDDTDPRDKADDSRDPGQGEPGQGGSGGTGGVGGTGGKGGDPSGVGGPGGQGGPGGAIDGIKGLRKIAVWVVLAALALVITLSLTVLAFQNQQDRHERLLQAIETEASERTTGLCDSTIQARATQLIFGEIIVEVSTEGSESADPGQRARIEHFRQLVDDRVIGKLPPICADQMTLEEFRQKVRHSAGLSAITPRVISDF